MKVITHENIKNLQISPKCCYQWVEEMIQNKKTAILPPKISMKMEGDVFCNIMPSIIEGAENMLWGGG